MDLQPLQYPIGKFQTPTEFNDDLISEWISHIEQLPLKLKLETEFLGKEELDYRYRPGGWTIRQVVHHLADSHFNSLARIKLALTEDKPVIRPYQENLWAELPDGKDAPISYSLTLLEGLHKRWVYLLKSLDRDQYTLEFVHPEYNKSYKLFEIAALYAWHCNHHLAHIKQAKERKEN